MPVSPSVTVPLSVVEPVCCALAVACAPQVMMIDRTNAILQKILLALVMYGLPFCKRQR